MIRATPSPIFLFVPTTEIANEYRDIYDRVQRIIILPAYATHQEPVNIYSFEDVINAFSDEIPSFESIISQNPRYNYVAGFYSVNIIPQFDFSSYQFDLEQIQEDLNLPARIETVPATSPAPWFAGESPTYFVVNPAAEGNPFRGRKADDVKIKAPFATSVETKMKFITEE
jgi:hypothetical protein